MFHLLQKIPVFLGGDFLWIDFCVYLSMKHLYFIYTVLSIILIVLPFSGLHGWVGVWIGCVFGSLFTARLIFIKSDKNI